MKNIFTKAIKSTAAKKLLSAVFLLLLSVFHASAQWASTDFLVTDYFGKIAVFDQNLVFQRYLDTSFPQATGLDFNRNGTLVAVGQTGRMKVYDPSGTIISDVTDANIGDPIDVKTSSSDFLYTGTQIPATAVSEFSASGVFNRSIGVKPYISVAVFGGTLWAGGNQVPGLIDVFDLQTGALTSSITLDNGQTNAASMRFSRSTNTVLMTDFDTNSIYERTPTGTFVRQFTPVSGVFGAVRGPGGDVYAVTGAPSQICRWQANGTLASCTLINTVITDAINIVWAGSSVVTTSNVTVSGKVIVGGSSAARAIVRYSDRNGTIHSTRTNQFGNFAFEEVEAGQTYIFQATAKGYNFESQVISVNENLTNLTFIGTE